MRAAPAAVILILASAFLAAPTATAGEQTIMLSVPGMTCASCPYIVRHAIAAVDGVIAVDVMFETRTAKVTFDDALTSLDTIRDAAAAIGYATAPVDDAGS